MLKIKWKWIWIGLGAIFLIFAMIPLVFVELTVPSELRRVDDDSLMGRTSRISTLSIIYDYKKEGRRVAVVQEPIVFVDDKGEDNLNKFLVVTRGYKTDFASLPWMARLFYSPFDEYAEAAIIHDWLYSVGEKGKKREADLIFFRVMLQDGVSPILARYFYTAVRFNTLFDNGGFGRASEWDNGFYSTVLEDDLPPSCIIDKPDTAFFKPSDLYSVEDIEDVSEETFNAEAPFFAATMQGRDPYFTAWHEALNSDACKIFILGTGIDRRTENQFQTLLDTYDEENDRRYISELLTLYQLLGMYDKQVERDWLYRPYIEGLLTVRFGEDIPESFWCLSLEDQDKILRRDILPIGTRQELGDWPAMTCSNTRAKAPQSGMMDACGDPHSSELDFLIGDWDFTNADTGEVWYQLNVSKSETCSVIARSISEDVDVRSLSYYDVLTGEWKHHWISTADVMEFKGVQISEGNVQMMGALTAPDVQWHVPAHLILQRLETGAVSYSVRFQPPGTSEWEVLFDGRLVARAG